uniref:Uncharacterized protein n=1 Tax=Ciona savignyi TaxID=51511 RepID=H2YEJ5_CIOSA
MGSFTDDIVSPVASHSKKIQHGMAGKQTNTRTSPHPLRQTNTPAVNPQSFHLESRLKPPKGQPNLDKNQDQFETPPSITLRATHSGTVVNGDDVRSARSETPTEVHEQPKPTLAENTPVTSEQASSFKPDAAAFQYQATYLRNSVKELVDELGDDIRSQVNEVFTEMVKLFLFQEDLIRELLVQRRCGINEQLLDELERLKQENEKLRRT